MDRFLVEELERIVGKEYMTTNRIRMLNYLADECPAPLRPKPADNIVLVRPADVQQVSGVLRTANRLKVPVYPRGGGTGLVGGAVPTQDGIVLSLERMKKVEVDESNLMVVAEAGVTLRELAEAADLVGLSFPPHPGDENAQVGGLVATNAGGSRAVRHGVMRSQVKAVQVVLADGTILNLGAKVHKNNVGYDLTQLIIGSEGTLAVITQATLRLYPKSPATMTLIIPYDNRRQALRSVPRILRDAATPLAAEYVQRDLVERTAKHIAASWPVKVGECFLIVILAESSRDQVLSESMKIVELCRADTVYDAYCAESKSDQENVLRIRSNIYSALKTETLDVLDITVPPSKLEEVMEAIDAIAKKHTTHLPIYGHAADGNLHVHIISKPGENMKYADDVRQAIYEIATRVGGVITGEHGVGKIRAGKLQTYLTREELELMKSIKRIFDPNGILNPGTKISI